MSQEFKKNTGYAVVRNTGDRWIRKLASDTRRDPMCINADPEINYKTLQK